MSKILRSPDGGSHVKPPMTTAQLARRMLTASAVVAKALPVGFYSAPALDILLALHVAEDEAHYPAIASLGVPGVTSPDLADRWIGLLIDTGLIEQRSGLLALTAAGHQTIIDLLQQVYELQLPSGPSDAS